MLATMKDMEVMDVDNEDQLGAVGNGGHYDADKKVEDVPWYEL